VQRKGSMNVKSASWNYHVHDTHVWHYPYHNVQICEK